MSSALTVEAPTPIRRRGSPFVCCVLALASCTTPRTVQEGTPPAAVPQQGSTSTWEGIHGGVERGVHRAAAWIDSFLSDERSLAEENRSWFSVRAEAFADQRDEEDLELRLGGRLVLPQLEERLHLVFGGEPEDVAGTEGPSGSEPTPPTSPAAVPEDAREADLGLQYMLRTSSRNHIRAEVGARFDEFDVDPYVGVRWRHTLPVGDWQARAAERLRAYADAGLDSRTTLDLERLVGEVRFFRATTYVRWREDEPGFDYGERFRLFQEVDDSRIVSFEWDNDFVTEPEDVLDALTLRVRVSHRWDHGHFLFEIAPQVSWREEYDYDPSAGLFLGLELSFGREDGP